MAAVRELGFILAIAGLSAVMAAWTWVEERLGLPRRCPPEDGPPPESVGCGAVVRWPVEPE